MEVKLWSEYSNEEKREILFHWWASFEQQPLNIEATESSKSQSDPIIDIVVQSFLGSPHRPLASSDEAKTFKYLVERRPDLMFDIAAINFLEGHASRPLIDAMKNGTLEEYIVNTKRRIMTIIGEDFVRFSEAKYQLLERIILSYNLADTSKPFTVEEIAQQLIDLDDGNFSI